MSLHSRDFNDEQIQFEEIERTLTNTYDESDKIDENNQNNESNEGGYQYQCDKDDNRSENGKKAIKRTTLD